ncbi:restriction endonuclease [Burkholderia seminalis]|uniref:restriction endonuclease n=1 Tax=Burkholderia seminalis TaxID=488731 RepID=UPI001453D4D8|nr:restriction endonuclease [Burkholderia seminalis]MCA8430558.1 restriction endonuclease [Burkholderia seminalis]VWB85246.1 hypothetical protein BSE24067_04065 [Burkholderia seminalis]
MAAYDFHQLSPHDLELLARDLLQAEWGVSIEDFKSGKDRGIDLRYAGTATSTIVQVKHYVRTGLAGLLRDLRKEATKVRRLKPGRYALVASTICPRTQRYAHAVSTKFVKPSPLSPPFAQTRNLL